MAITIRNKKTEAMIRRLGELWGSGPSEVIRRLADRELERTAPVSEAEFQQRMAVWDELDHEFPPPTEEEKRQIRYEMDHMYDYLEKQGVADHAKKKRAAR